MLNHSICLIFLAVVASGARVDDTHPEDKRQEEATQEKKPTDDPFRKPKWFCERENIKKPTVVQLAEREKEEALAGQDEAEKNNKDHDAAHVDATDKEDMSYVMSVIQKTAAQEYGLKAREAQTSENSAAARRQSAAEKLKYARQHEAQANRLAELHKAEADEASEKKKEADEIYTDDRVRYRYTKEQRDLAVNAAHDAKSLSDAANEKAQKAREWKAESAEIRDESEQAKIQRAEEASAAAADAVHKVHAHHLALEHLKKMKREAALSKVELAVAKKRKQEAIKAAVVANIAEKKSDTRAHESVWSARGAVERLGTDTATALSAFSERVGAQKEAQLRVKKHEEARTALKAAHAAFRSATKDKEIADAAVSETEEHLPSPTHLAMVNPKGELAKKVGTELAAEFPEGASNESESASNASDTA